MNLQDPQEPPPVVDLVEDEFHRIYSALRICLAREMEVDTLVSEDDDTAFLKRCQQALEQRDRDERYFHFNRGFLPLFERLVQAMAVPVRTDGGVIYRVTFS